MKFEILKSRNFSIYFSYFATTFIIRPRVVIITTAQLHSSKPEFRLCAGSNPNRGVLDIRDGEDQTMLPAGSKPKRLSSVNHTAKQFIAITLPAISLLRLMFSWALTFHKKLCYLLQWKPFKNGEKCFLFHLKSSFRSDDI